MHETRQVGLGELKFAGSDSDMTFSGYGAAFGNVDSYGDVIAEGAFAKTLSQAKATGNWPAMLSQHGGGMFSDDPTPIGVWTEMREDSQGLYVEGKLAPTAKGQEAYALLKMQPRPALNGLSIGFRPTEWVMRSKPDEPRRTLKAVDLLEVSIVTFPANGKARVAQVKATDMKTIRDFEEFLRDVGGFSHAAAKAIASGGFKANLDPRDEDSEADVRALQDRFSALRRA